MGRLPDALYDELLEASQSYLTGAIPAERNVGWVCEPSQWPNEIVGGVGIQVRELAPRPDPSGQRLGSGPERYVLNVFTERSWRRRGVARALMCTLMDWARAHGIRRLSLHTSAERRRLYESLGFIPVEEFRCDEI